MNIKKKCFVIMPFAKAGSAAEQKWTEIFEHTIKPAVKESRCGHKCERYEFRRANIIKDILQELNNAHVVIADLTDHNPNVLWELGVRHTLSKRTILIAQDKRFLPSDLKDYPIITYKYKQTPTETHRFKQEIKDKLKDIEADPEKPDSPIADFLKLKNIDLLAFEKSENLKKLNALISELSYNIDATDVIITQLKEVEEDRKKGKKEKKGPYATPVRLANACLELLATDQYILLPQELLTDVRDINELIGSTNRSLDLWPQFGKKVEKRLRELLPGNKEWLIDLLKGINQVKLDYANDNYQEPKESAILLANPKHEKYLRMTGQST